MGAHTHATISVRVCGAGEYARLHPGVSALEVYVVFEACFRILFYTRFVLSVSSRVVRPCYDL